MSRPIVNHVGDFFPDAKPWSAQDIRQAALDIPWGDSLDLIQIKLQVLHLLMLTDVITPKLTTLEQSLQKQPSDKSPKKRSNKCHKKK